MRAWPEHARMGIDVFVIGAAAQDLHLRAIDAIELLQRPYQRSGSRRLHRWLARRCGENIDDIRLTPVEATLRDRLQVTSRFRVAAGGEMGRLSFRLVKYGSRWYAQAKRSAWILSGLLPPFIPFWRVISHHDLEIGLSSLEKVHAEFPLIYAHDTSEAAADTISRFIDKLDAEREKKRTRIEVVLPVEVVRVSEERTL